MLSAGLDIGSLYSKAVVLKDGALLGSGVLPTGEDISRTVEQLLTESLAPLGASPNDLDAAAATGAGKTGVALARSTASEVLCVARGISYLHPEARGVIDLGGESTWWLKLDEAGDVLEFSLNDKCASGTGIFLDAMAEVMGVPLEEMGPLSLRSTADVHITSTCVVFAESEVVSQVHRQTPREDILRGIHRSIAVRVHGLVNRVGLNGRSLAVGGLALNTGIIACLGDLYEGDLAVPEQPQIVGALGAALIAAETEVGA